MKPLDEYQVGDQLECAVDAFPSPLVMWQNLRTGQSFGGTTFTVQQEWLGTSSSMRCQAQNIVNGIYYSADFFITVHAVRKPQLVLLRHHPQSWLHCSLHRIFIVL